MTPLEGVISIIVEGDVIKNVGNAIESKHILELRKNKRSDRNSGKSNNNGSGVWKKEKGQTNLEEAKVMSKVVNFRLK